MEAVKLTREDLYERVLAEPMSKLAQHYGLSDVGLAKTCKRLRYPFRTEATGRKRPLAIQ
jgi:hypothetical protein